MFRCYQNIILSISVVILCLVLRTPANSFTTSAKQLILVDAKTGQVLLEKNADELMHPASMSKIMTVYLAFEAIKKGH